MSVVEVFDLRQYIQVTFGSGAGMSLKNYPVNITDIRVFRGIENSIDFRVRDIDRKPVVLAVGTVLDLVVKSEDRERIVKRLSVLDANRGVYRATIDDEELPTDTNLLNYFLVMTDANGHEHLLFTDRSRGPKGTFVIADGPNNGPSPTLEITGSDLLPQGAALRSAALESEGSLHTIVVENDFFTGTLVVEATLDESPAITDDRWFEVERRNYVDQVDRDIINVTGNFSYVRFKVSPGIDNDGELIRILYR